MTFTQEDTLLRHLENCIVRYPELSVCSEAILQAYQALESVFRKGFKLLLCGNGGSCADADHMSAELMKNFILDRPLPLAWKEKLGEPLAAHLQGSFPAIPLSAFPAFNSAFANDCDGKYTYAQLVWSLGAPGDALLAFSTSGNSENILNALKTARAKGITTIGLSGKTAGNMKPLLDVSIQIPETQVHKIQERHLPVYHTLSLMLEEAFFA